MTYAKKYWSLEDIPWDRFDASKVRPEITSVVKAACMVEHNSEDYARYLCQVFPDDPVFQEAARHWATEEVQHGQALRKWAELADPAFNFERSFNAFTTGYKIPVEATESVRGSRCGELIARCIVETGTSAHYLAIQDCSEEPVLKAICAHIAADELRHYKLFYTHLKAYLQKDRVNLMKRLAIALGRIGESSDDELAYAFYAAHPEISEYDRKACITRYLRCISVIYRKEHVERMTAMVLKAVGLKANGALSRAASRLAWRMMCWRGYAVAA